ncbi:MAG TPA: hypothetical protein VL327_06435 [Pyrinomonadaceae bacterium]|jgi:hypothetical protein|nr:hypothetical protein [Pyrinomonadaceae bacterium]
MIKSFCLGFAVSLALSVISFSQVITTEPLPKRSRVVVTNTLPPPTKIVQATPKPTPVVVGNDDEENSGPSENEDADEKPLVVGNATRSNGIDSQRSTTGFSNVRTLSFGEIKSKIAEARRDMMTRTQTTAIADPIVPVITVKIAFYNWKAQRVDFVSLTKDDFLSTSGLKQAVSTSGKMMTVRTIRGNGVNTPLEIRDESGQLQLPLLVQYPVEKGGRIVETAYYMSTHPGLVTPEVVNAGKFYVRNVIEIARDRLKSKGIVIQPKVADIAERLATVEHVDHDRFRNEPAQNIFNDIFTLYALNEGQTYRYSVSSAGAGGMVQMIPSTYRMIRSRYSNVGLMPDFVEGMRNHVNATEAMLLYMQMTWDDLRSSPTITGAMADGTATQEQLMAAGYNSNPARLAGYINRGGANWTALIPAETKIYLQIYSALEKNVPMASRTH